MKPETAQPEPVEGPRLRFDKLSVSGVGCES